MPQSLAQIYIHIVFATKHRYPFLKDKTIRKELHTYIGGLCNHLDCQSIIVGGYIDHEHILCRFSRSITIAKLVGEVKRNSSKWIKTKGNAFTKFVWQNGYGVFSVGRSEIDRVKTYIENQEQHHKNRNFQDEYRAFLDEYNIEYDERYVWD